MFEETNKDLNINKNIAPAPSAPKLASGKAPFSRSLSSKTEDIFAEVDKKIKPEVFKPKPSQPSYPGDLISEEKPSLVGENKKFLVLGLIIISLFIVLAGSFFVLKRFFKTDLTNKNNLVDEKSTSKTEENQTNNSQLNPEDKEQEVPPTDTAPVVTPSPVIPPVVSQPVDTDQDGLIDEEEVQLGTNISLPDSDSDGLFDREEVKVYQTNPLNADTDGDGYLDGEEVRNNYNPKGSGKLYEIK